MSNNGIRRKKNGQHLRILSLDGGGVRGYSMLIILEQLMHSTFNKMTGNAPTQEQIPKPCDHFDLIAGTGTGGLIAIMLGRLRMDIETCKAVYVEMTKKVFEKDKTIGGIPWKSTLFKTTQLEEAIKNCVKEHTIHDDEGNDSGDGSGMTSLQDLRMPMSPGAVGTRVNRSASNASRYSRISMTPVNMHNSASEKGNEHARLYDNREYRTKCAVTAVYKGSKDAEQGQVFLRSYDSRKHTAIEHNATIWQAGRATCATKLAFKEIQIGQYVFLDEGVGKYNPAPMVLEEAVVNEWPGRGVGVFISIGTGKRPKGTNFQQHLWWEGFVSSAVGKYAEARRRLINKIEDCEKTHLAMKDYLATGERDEKVKPLKLEDYYRLNVNVGVGEFGMNEWDRLGEISTNTRIYLADRKNQKKTEEIAGKLADIYLDKRKQAAMSSIHPALRPLSWKPANAPLSTIPDASPLAVELPAEEVTPDFYSDNQSQQSQAFHVSPAVYRRTSENDKFAIVSSDEYPRPMSHLEPRHSGEHVDPNRRSGEQFTIGSIPNSPRVSIDQVSRHSPPPPRPPKTPLQDGTGRPPYLTGSPTIPPPTSTLPRPPPGALLPYPDTDGPPPVNMARKPEFSR